MPLVPSFTITPTGNPAAFIVTDTSTGSDDAITDRQISIYAPGNVLAYGPIDFPLSAGSSITVAPLTTDGAFNVVVTWNNIGGVPIYTASLIFAFVQYGLQFLQALTQSQISNPSIVNDNNWITNKLSVFLEIKSALNSIVTGQSVSAAQSCILRYLNTIANQNILF